MKTAVVEFLRIDHSLGIAAGETGQQRRGTTLGIRLPKDGHGCSRSVVCSPLKLEQAETTTRANHGC